MKPKSEIVCVEWIDSVGVGQDWRSFEDISLIEHRCFTVGYLVAENDLALVVVPHLSPEDEVAMEQGCGDMLIPRVAVKSVSKLTSLLDSSEKIGSMINRRVTVESQLWDMYQGKKELPDREKCREMALKLGVPNE